MTDTLTDLRTLLVVDDDEPFRSRLIRALRERGFDATGAGSSAEALAAAEKDAPELALVDLKLGDRSGLDVVKALKALDEGTISSCSRVTAASRRPSRA